MNNSNELIESEGNDGLIHLVIAIIRPEELNNVRTALKKVNITKMTVIKCKGCGEEEGYHETFKGADKVIDLLDKIRIEIAVTGAYSHTAIDTICNAAETGEVGDGKIFIIRNIGCIRIRTREKGTSAVG